MFQGKPFSGSCADTCGQTDGHDEGNGCFFCNYADAPKMPIYYFKQY